MNEILVIGVGSLLVGMIAYVVAHKPTKPTASEAEPEVWITQDANLWLKPEEELNKDWKGDYGTSQQANAYSSVDTKKLETELKRDENLTEEEFSTLRRNRVANNKVTQHDFLKLTNKQTTIRLLPSHHESQYVSIAPNPFFVARKQHYIGDKPPLLCSQYLVENTEYLPYEKRRWEGNCPLCNLRSDLMRHATLAKLDDDPAMARDLLREADKIKATERFYYNVILKKSGNWEGPYIWTCGRLIHDELQKKINTLVEEYEINDYDIFDLSVGLDLVIGREVNNGGGGTYFPKYSATFKESQTAVKDETFRKHINANLWDLSKVIKTTTGKEMAETYKLPYRFKNYMISQQEKERSQQEIEDENFLNELSKM